MSISRIQFVARCVGMIIVITAAGLSGCNRNTEPAASSPLAATATMPAGHPASTPVADPHAMPTMERPAAGNSTAAGASLKVTVSLSPAVAKKAAPNDVVFIFARAVHGPRMPLAIVRKQVKDLPATIVLDDSAGMMSDMKLSSVPEVIVVARVSKSGMANAQPGDLEGMSAPISPSAKSLDLSIAKVVTGQ